MLFTIDIGNTNMVLGGFEGDKIRFLERLSTDQGKTSLEYALILKNISGSWWWALAFRPAWALTWTILPRWEPI